MELELRQETVRGWESVCRATLEQEETAEMIVPDACPDIWQVLDGEARLLLQRKEPQDGKGEFSGLLKTTILYQPEGEQGLRAMEVTLPFSASPELTQLTRRSMLHVIPRVLSVDVHLLNPRKVLVRVGYCLDIEGFEPQARSLTSLVEEPERYGIRQKTGELRSFQTVYAQEKAFTYQDTVVLPAGRPDAVELLRTRAQCTCTEARVIGSKLVFKGEAMLQLLCRGEDGALFTGEFHLPYSQIMDAGEDSEEGMCSMDLLFTDVKCTPVEEDRRSFQVELAVQAQAVLRREVTVPILTDLYSTAYEVQPEEVTCPVLHLLGQGEEQESVREVVGTQGLPGNLLDVQARLGRTGQSQEGEDQMLTQEVELVVLYDTEEGLASARQKVVVQHRLSGQSGGVLHGASPGTHRCAGGRGSGGFFPPGLPLDGSGKGGGPGDWPGDLGGKAGARRPAALCDSPGSPPWGGPVDRGQGLPDHGQRHYGGQRPDLWGDFPGPDAADPPEEQLKGAPRHTVPGRFVWRFMMDTGGREADSCGFYRHSRWSVLPAGDRRPWAVPEW